MRLGGLKNLVLRLSSATAGVLAGAVITYGCQALAQAAASQSAPACWSPAALAFHKGEERVSKGVDAAFVSPPERDPVQADPVVNYGALRRVQTDRKVVALTFDLCEQPSEVAGYQGDIVDFLREHHVEATFFAGGKWMLTHRERAEQLMSDPLFEVGNHTWEHRNLRLLGNGSPLLDEIEGAQLAYEQVRAELEDKQCVGLDSRTLAYKQALPRLGLFRFPFGACDAKSLDAVARMGLHAVQWDVSSGDPAPHLSAEAMVRGVLTRVRPGSIVLFHANGRGHQTGSALPAIVEGLRERGYEFVTVSRLLETGRPVYTPTCYDGKPGDTDRYDGWAAHLEALLQRAKEQHMAGKAFSRSQDHRPPGDLGVPQPGHPRRPPSIGHAETDAMPVGSIARPKPRPPRAKAPSGAQPGGSPGLEPEDGQSH